jgi:rod shape determining protein RodA
MIETSALRRADFFLLLLIVLLSLVGIVVLRGATRWQPLYEPYAIRQTAWLCIGLIVFFLAILIDYHHLETAAYWLYGFHVAALGYLLVAGRSIKGAKSWISLGFMNWQPSETMKIAAVLVLARILASRARPPRTIRGLIVPGIAAGIPFLLVVAQPDIGSASIFLAIFLGMLFWAGTPKRILVGMLAAGLLLGAAAYPFLKPYQRARITTFINPEKDPLGDGYNLMQSKIALGSGEITGKGWGQGTQTTLEFLPEHHSDFIFSSLGEQFGFLGCFVVIGLYGLVAWRGLGVVSKARDQTGALIVGGMMSIFLAHLLVNLGMVFGFMPVTGLPLPFLSAGGSSLVTNFLLFGLVVNVSMRQYMFGIGIR